MNFKFQFFQKLTGFKVLCLANESGITDEQAEAVWQFVADGGGLIATGETLLYDQKGQRRQDYALEDVFDASYVHTLAADKRGVEFDLPERAGLGVYRCHDVWGIFPKMGIGDTWRKELNIGATSVILVNHGVSK